MACLGPCVSCSKDSPLQGSCYFEEEGFEWSPFLSLHPDADTELTLMGVGGWGVSSPLVFSSAVSGLFDNRLQSKPMI